MLFVPLTRAVEDPDTGYSTAFYLNIDQALSIARSNDNTHTRIRGTSVYTPPDTPASPPAFASAARSTVKNSRCRAPAIGDVAGFTVSVC